MVDQRMEQAVEKRIKEFANLPNGWHFGEGVCATKTAVQQALDVNALFEDYGARVTEAFPCVDGGVLVCGYQGTDVLEVQCDPNSDLHLDHERNGVHVDEQEAISIDDIERYLGKLAWSSSASFTRSITAGSLDDTLALRFSRPLLDLDSQYLNPNAESNVAVLSADTLKISIWETGLLRLFSGDSVQAYYPWNAALKKYHLPMETVVTETSWVSHAAYAEESPARI